MSKLYNEYLRLKSKKPDKFFLFDNGLFYIFLDSDAKIVSEKIGLKLTTLNDTVVKCGFPHSQITKYQKFLQNSNIIFEIIDRNYNAIDNYTDYINNDIAKNILDTINSLDLDNTSPKEAFEILLKFQTLAKKLKND